MFDSHPTERTFNDYSCFPLPNLGIKDAKMPVFKHGRVAIVTLFFAKHLSQGKKCRPYGAFFKWPP